MTTSGNAPPLRSSLDSNDGNMAAPTTFQIQQQSMHDSHTSNHENLLEELVQLVSLPPSKEGLNHLANMISTNVKIVLSSMSTSSLPSNTQHDATMASSSTTNQSIIIAYLRAAAHQLREVSMRVHSQPPSTTTSVAHQAPFATVGTAMVLDSNNGRDSNIEACSRTLLVVICTCISQLRTENEILIVTDAGILESLWYLVEFYDVNHITNFACEFLQACILCKQYHFAYDRIVHTWPMPTKASDNSTINPVTLCSVETVLRYYYLRGIVCMGCSNQKDDLAIRCFWTCLSIPTTTDANTVSAIAIAAYKKLIVLQAISPMGVLHTAIIRVDTAGRNFNVDDYNSNDNSSTSVIPNSTSMSSTSSSGVPTITIPSATNPLSTPKEMSWDLVRFIAQAKSPTIVSSSVSDSSSSVDNSLKKTPPSTKNRYTYPHLGVHVYKQLIQAFIMVDRMKCNFIIHQHEDLFCADGNYGCVSRLSNALYYREIYVISRSYASLPLQLLCTEMNSLPIDHVRLLLHTLQNKLSWPVNVITTKTHKERGEEEEEVVIFPSDLPRPIMVATSDREDMQTQKLIELSETVQQLNKVMESSTKYKNALLFYDHQKDSKNTSKKVATSMVMEDSFLNYQF